MFEQFLAGDTLEECYAAVASVADRWLDLLDTQVISTPGKMWLHLSSTGCREARDYESVRIYTYDLASSTTERSPLCVAYIRCGELEFQTVTIPAREA